MVKNPPAMQETPVQFLGQKDPLEMGTATNSSILHVVYNGYDVVNYSGFDLRNTVGVISSIQWM